MAPTNWTLMNFEEHDSKDNLLINLFSEKLHDRK